MVMIYMAGLAGSVMICIGGLTGPAIHIRKGRFGGLAHST